ncbi:SPOR domain-containing protein [Alteriqipengyuania lutimaris]|uniref:Sporulation protein n=1 Tax=Alteriqipengyuania lutimaris TaxID=1538146 RepID=A0A395LM51_9SPHN|nr:SPOR domain-containing protein [Alteriqipengyuania lutimaris]MBB3033524.1 cell division septation protein DedD [Alteriqipengyuania lutimaris]RDS77467.1 sporulation protein [Alteriqipengyuania lutimaris]
MTKRYGRDFGLRAAFAGVLLTFPALALADVNAGVAAWQQGDYATAVAEWRGPANAGDADAQFNMGQAYRLGRGVEQNTRQAEVFYAKAAAQGHAKAADNLGLLLFQNGRREDAMPYVVDAAQRGDPRAQYLLGIAHFNGDLVERDWVRAYALLTLANSAGLPQAASAVQQMDTHIPLDQREAAQTLVPQLKRAADARRASQLAAADLDSVPDPAPAGQPRAMSDAGRMPAPAGAIATSRAQRIPRAVPETRVAPSVAAAQSAIAEASRVTGTESPGDAGVTFARRSAPDMQPGRLDPGRVEAQPTTPVVARPAPQPRPQPEPARAVPAREARAASEGSVQRAMDGPWKVQLGAFAVDGNAERLWARLSGRAELAGATRVLEPVGRVTKLLAGGYASRSDAQTACNALKRSGQECLVTR